MPDNSLFTNETYRTAQKACLTQDNVLSTINLYNGMTAFPLSLVSLDGSDNLSLTVQASYQGNMGKTMEQLNKDTASGVLGFGWALPITRIAVKNPLVKNNYQADFYLVSEGGHYPLYRTLADGEAVCFLSLEHPLWKLTYYNTTGNSRWEIYKEDGSKWIYGGSEDSIETGLCWDGWVGAAAINGGEEYPVGWCLSGIQSYSGNKVTYEYDNIKEAIGDKTYTRAVHYKHIISTYGEKVEFRYEKKEGFEGEMPHQSNNGTNAYQFTYDDQYLDSLQVSNQQGLLLYTQKLEYDIEKQTDKSTAKRFLKTVTQLNNEGEPMSPLCLDYETSSDAPIMGALSRVRYPTGSQLHYEYEKLETTTQSTKGLLPPDKEWNTQIYQGEDYTVSIYTLNQMLRLKVTGWNIDFYEFEDSFINNQGIDEHYVFLGQGYFALMYHSLQNNVWKVRLYKKSPVRVQDWKIEDIPLEVEQNRPAVTCGRDFFAVQYSNLDTLLISQFNYVDNQWHYFNLPVECQDFQALGAGNGFILGAYYNESGQSLRIQTFYANEEHEWKLGDNKDLFLKVEWGLTNAFSVWSIGDQLASATFVSLDEAQIAKSTVLMIRWRYDFMLAEIEDFSITQSSKVKNPILYSLVNDNVIGLAQNIFRYSPKKWNQRTLLTPGEGGEYRYAYGSDLALAVENINGCQKFYSLRFDPYLLEWVEEGAPKAEERYGETSLCLPYIFGEFVVLGRQLFTRDTKEHWNFIYNFEEQVDMSSIQIREEGDYLLYQLTDGSGIYMLNLFNRMPNIVCQLEGQKCLSEGSPMAAHGFFTTYTGESLIKSDEVTMYLVRNAQYSKTQEVSILKSVSLDSGFSNQQFQLEYNFTTAAIWENRVDFMQVKVLPGDKEESLGYTEYNYFNGRAPEENQGFYPPVDEFGNAKDFYTYFSGRLYSSKIYDNNGNPIEGTINYEKVLDPYGFIIGQRKLVNQTWLPTYDKLMTKEVFTKTVCNNENELQIVESVMEYEYDSKHYLKRKIIQESTDSKGKLLRISQNYIYGFEVYEELRDCHLLDCIIQTTKNEDISNKVLEASATRWGKGSYGNLCEIETYNWEGNGDSVFHFQEQQDGWQSTGKVLERGEKGIITCQVAQDDIVHSFLYDEKEIFLLGEFKNAYTKDVEFCSFEPYEAMKDWETTAKSLDESVTDELCYNGSRCLKIDGYKNVVVTLTKKPTNLSQAYLLQCAYKTEDMTADTCIQAEIMKADGKKITLSIPMKATGGRWQVFRQCLHFEDYVTKEEKDGTVYLRFSCESLGILYLDLLFFTPFTCEANADVYDMNTLLKTGSFSNIRKGNIILYDRINRPIIGARDQGEFLRCTCREDGNQDNQNNTPALTLTAEFSDLGNVYPLYRGLDFTKDWDKEGNWRFTNKCLVHSDTSKATLIYKESTWNQFVLFLDVKEQDNTGLSFALGNVVIKQNGVGWNALDSGVIVAASAYTTYKQNSYVVLCIGNRLSFCGNGKVLFTFSLEKLQMDQISIESNSNCSITALGIATAPKVLLTYSDYIGRPIQDQTITEEGIITTQSIYTSLGQAAIQTKLVEQQGLWGYRKGFVENFNWETGVLTGEIAEAFPEDAGYPYTQTITNICPNPHPVEFAQPGKQWSAYEPLELKKTVKLGKCTNQKDFFGLNLEEGICYIEVITDPDGKETIICKDIRKNKIAQILYSTLDGLIEKTAYEYDENNRITKVLYPNYFSDNPDSNQFVSTISYDFYGNLTQRSEPDIGNVVTVFDALGKLRFIQDETSKTAGGYIYHLYDDLGRETEVGFCSGNWDFELLKKAARSNLVPPDGGEWTKQIEYDGDGTDTYLLGKVWKTRTKSKGMVVTETYQYDEYENVIYKEQSMLDNLEQLYIEYDSFGNRTKITDGKGLIDLRYQYDLHGRMSKVYWKDSCICSYTHTANGTLESEAYYPENENEILRNYSYNSAQWLTTIKDNYFTQNLMYENAAKGGRYGGQISYISHEFTKTQDSLGDFIKKVEVQYQYDGLGRLISASNLTYPEYSMGAQKELAYDCNRNMYGYDQSTFHYENGKNCLQAVNDKVVEYNEIGSVTKMLSNNIIDISYDLVLHNISSLQTENQRTEYYYNSQNGIAAVKEEDQIRYNLLDLDGKVLIDYSKSSPCICIRGVNGVFAMVSQGEIYYLLRDYQLSIRAICHKGSLCAAYNYMPFGNFMGGVFETEEVKNLIPLRFTSQRLEITGLYQMDQRWYDPISGRFLSIDPQGQYSSPFIYGGGDWINYFDPSGSFSWGAFGSIVVGLTLVVLGGALSVATMGIGSGVGATMAVLGSSFLIGAGIGGMIYGVSSAITGDFNLTECAINFAAGGIFGMLGAGLGAAVPAGFTMFGLSSAASTIIVDIGIGVVVGGCDGLITNGCINVVNHEDFFHNALINVSTGMLMGGIMSGMTGMGSALRNVKALHSGARTESIFVGLGRGSAADVIGHSSIYNTEGGRIVGSDLIKSNKVARIRYFDNANIRNTAHFKTKEIKVSQQVKDGLALGGRAGDAGNYNIVTNNCAGYVIRTLADSGLNAPLWARTPITLFRWASLLG